MGCSKYGFVSLATAVGLPAVLLISTVDLSVPGCGYVQTAYFTISKCPTFPIRPNSTAMAFGGLVLKWSCCILTEHWVAGYMLRDKSCKQGQPGSNRPPH